MSGQPTPGEADQVSVVDALEPSASGPGTRRAAPQWAMRLYPVVALVVVVLVWEGVVRVAAIPMIYLPPPSAVLSAVGDLLADPQFYGHLGTTVRRIALGFALGATAGVACGLLMGTWRIVEILANGFIRAFYPLPKVALIPLLIVWLGTGEPYKVAVSAVSAFFPVVISTYVGIRQVDAGLVKAARNLGCSGRQLQQKVIVPAALPSIFGGVRLGLGVTMILVIAAEMVGGTDGLGYLLIFAGQLLMTQRVFAVLTVLTLLGWLLMKAEETAEHRFAPWASSSNGTFI